MASTRASSSPCQAPSDPFHLVAFGGSAGCLAPLQDVLHRLPASFPIPIVVVQHLGAHLTSRLPEILGFRCRLQCRWAADGDRPQTGAVLVAPPGSNLVLSPERVLRRAPGPKPRLGWPSVDEFLLSMAAGVGPNGIAVIMSGMMHDGAQGIAAVRRAGGATMVQHPSTAEHPDMPSAAVDLGRADLQMTSQGIAEALEILGEAGVQ